MDYFTVPIDIHNRLRRYFIELNGVISGRVYNCLPNYSDLGKLTFLHECETIFFGIMPVNDTITLIWSIKFNNDEIITFNLPLSLVNGKLGRYFFKNIKYWSISYYSNEYVIPFISKDYNDSLYVIKEYFLDNPKDLLEWNIVKDIKDKGSICFNEMNYIDSWNIRWSEDSHFRYLRV